MVVRLPTLKEVNKPVKVRVLLVNSVNVVTAVAVVVAVHVPPAQNKLGKLLRRLKKVVLALKVLDLQLAEVVVVAVVELPDSAAVVHETADLKEVTVVKELVKIVVYLSLFCLENGLSLLMKLIYSALVAHDPRTETKPIEESASTGILAFCFYRCNLPLSI